MKINPGWHERNTVGRHSTGGYNVSPGWWLYSSVAVISWEELRKFGGEPENMEGFNTGSKYGCLSPTTLYAYYLYAVICGVSCTYTGRQQIMRIIIN